MLNFSPFHIQGSHAYNDEHNLADPSSGELLPPSQLHPPRRQAGKHSSHQGRGRQAMRFRVRQDIQ